MPISVHFHDDLCLRVHRIFGAVSPNQFRSLASFYERVPSLARFDLITVIDDDLQFAPHTLEDFAALGGIFQNLHVSSDFILQRRSAWVCANAAAWPVLEAWLDERHALDGQGAGVCLVARLADAATLFEPNEIEAVESWRGFREIARIDA